MDNKRRKVELKDPVKKITQGKKGTTSKKITPSKKIPPVKPKTIIKTVSVSSEQELSCNVSTKQITYGQTAFMQMKANPRMDQGQILPQLNIQNWADAPNPPRLEASINGLEADISLTKIRVETIHVVYRGLCDLSLLIQQNFTNRYITQTGGNYNFKLSYEVSGNPSFNVDFEQLFTQKNIKRDDLAHLVGLDRNMLITIGFLERLKGLSNIPLSLRSKIDEVLNNFIVCSSGKEYLDVGQLYAIIEPNTIANSQIVDGFWNEPKITARIAQMDNFKQLFIGQLYPFEKGLSIPKRPFYETYDSAAAPIAGKYYNTYTEATIPLAGEAMLNLGTYSNPGSIPFLYDNNQVLYLCFLYNYSLLDRNFNGNAQWFNRSPNGTNIFNLCKNIREVKTTFDANDGRVNAPVFDLLYSILSNDFNNDIIKNFYKSKDIQTYKNYKLIDLIDYDIISSVYYFFMEQQHRELSNRQNLITANLDSLCHDNKDSPIYRYLMMYNLIKKNNNSNDDLSNPLLKELLETFRPIPQTPPIASATPSEWLPLLPNPLNSDNDINNALNNLIFNFSDLEKKMFGLLATQIWSATEVKLINRMICNNCYVFPVIQSSSISTNKLVLISMDEALGINCIDPRGPSESPDVRRAAYASFNMLFPRQQGQINLLSIFQINTQIQVRSIIPHFSRCCCDLAISDNLSLTKVDVPDRSYGTSIFNITPVTLNDAASAALDPAAIYLPDPVTIQFGNTIDPDNYNYNLVFWGYDETRWAEYRQSINGLKYFFNLQAFNTDYNRALTILRPIEQQFADIFNRFHYILQDLASAGYSTKRELYERILCFEGIYDTIIRRFILDDEFNIEPHLNCLTPFCRELDINPDECNYRTLYNTPGSTFEINLKKTIEKLASNMHFFRVSFDRNQNSAKKDAAYSNPPVFRNLVDGVMELITYIDEILRKQPGISADNNNILECEKKIIGEWLIPFITNLALPFIGTVPPCPAMRGGNGKNGQSKTTNIPITSFIGQYGFYQVPDDDGRLTFKPINTLEEQKQVWEMLGIQVNPVPSSNLIDNTDKGIDTNLTQIRKEGIIRNLMNTKGLSLEQATSEVDKPYTLPQGKEIVIPPATNIQQLREKYPELKEGPDTGNKSKSSVGVVGTKTARTGGKYTRKIIKNKKRKNKTNKNRLFRKKNKNIIRRTRRKH